MASWRTAEIVSPRDPKRFIPEEKLKASRFGFENTTEAVTVELGLGVTEGLGDGATEALGLGLGDGEGLGEGLGFTLGLGEGLGATEAEGLGLGITLIDGDGMGETIALGDGLGVGDGDSEFTYTVIAPPIASTAAAMAKSMFLKLVSINLLREKLLVLRC